MTLQTTVEALLAVTALLIGTLAGSPHPSPSWLALPAGAGMAGLGLLWRSRRREPRPWRVEDRNQYERRGSERKHG